MQTELRGPKGHFLMGSLPEFAADTLGFMLKMREYGDIGRVRFGPFAVYVLSHPDAIHEVMVEDAAQYYKSSATKNVMAPAVGNGIFTSDGDFWRRQRKLVQPAFHTKRIGAYADIITRFASQMVSAWRDGEAFQLDEAMAHLTMRIISKTLFDAEMEEDLRIISESVTTVLRNTDERFNQIPTIPYWMPTKLNRELRAAIKRLDALIQRFVADRRRTGEDKGDLLSMLLAAQDEDGSRMTDKQVRDEAVTLFGAGHETTAVALTWTFYLLSQHPDIEAKLLEEVDGVLGGRAATLSDLPKLPYAEQVLKESMRLYPPAWGTTREAIKDTTLSGHPIRRGDTILINIYGVHRDARFFPDPERFDPGRFNPEHEKDIAKYAYLPFGTGPRVCIGNAFAMMEARLVLATVLQKVRLELAPGHVVQPERQFTLRPKYGMRMVVHARQATSAPVEEVNTAR